MKHFELHRILPILMILAFSACTASKKAVSPPGEFLVNNSLDYRRSIVGYAEQFKGIKYHYTGKSPDTGFDCSGFVYYVFKQYHISVSPASAELKDEGKPVELDQVQPGDLVFFSEGSGISHVAMVVKRNSEGVYIIHSTNHGGVMIDNISTSAYWKPKIRFARDVITR
jgi:cell wall-associated NlpC family hydrolase